MFDTGDTSFMMICAALVFIMTPGLAFFYGGLVNKKNVLTIMMQSFVSLGVVTVLWFIFGFSLTFGSDVHGIIGNLVYCFLNGVGMDPNPDYGSTIPFFSFFSYQQMFAILTPALITGAFADRVNFKSYLVFLVFWVYLFTMRRLTISNQPNTFTLYLLYLSIRPAVLPCRITQLKMPGACVNTCTGHFTAVLWVTTCLFVPNTI